jgi:hypothetical protein
MRWSPEELDYIKCMDRLISTAEGRRNSALRKIDRRRAVLGEAVRRSEQGFDDGQYKLIGTTPRERKRRGSDRKRKANRANARANTGPQTAHGRVGQLETRFATRSVSRLFNSSLVRGVGTLAGEIAGTGANAETQELAPSCRSADRSALRALCAPSIPVSTNRGLRVCFPLTCE